MWNYIKNHKWLVLCQVLFVCNMTTYMFTDKIDYLVWAAFFALFIVEERITARIDNWFKTLFVEDEDDNK